MINFFNWLSRTATNGEVIGLALLSILYIYAFFRTYIELTSRINELENRINVICKFYPESEVTYDSKTK